MCLQDHHIFSHLMWGVSTPLMPLNIVMPQIQILVKSDIMIGTALRDLLRPCSIHTALWPVRLQLHHVSCSTCHLQVVSRFIWEFDWCDPTILWVSWIWAPWFACNSYSKQYLNCCNKISERHIHLLSAMSCSPCSFLMYSKWNKQNNNVQGSSLHSKNKNNAPETQNVQIIS